MTGQRLSRRNAPRKREANYAYRWNRLGILPPLKLMFRLEVFSESETPPKESAFDAGTFSFALADTTIPPTTSSTTEIKARYPAIAVPI
jgi:hypothetical protein